MGHIHFKWKADKAIQATAYIVARLQSVEKIVLTKLLYLADRDHFLMHGAPITGDSQVAMRHGPVPSAVLDLMDGELRESKDFFEYLHQDDFVFSVRKDAGHAQLSDSETAILDKVLKEHGAKPKWVLLREMHRLPEFEQTYRVGTSTRIPYEVMLQCYDTGDGMRFYKGRPVLSPETMAQLPCPYPPWQ